jgi:hypothetical protein
LWRSLAAQFAVALAETQLHRIPRIAVAIAHLLENFALSRWKRSLPVVSSRDIGPAINCRISAAGLRAIPTSRRGRSLAFQRSYVAVAFRHCTASLVPVISSESAHSPATFCGLSPCLGAFGPRRAAIISRHAAQANAKSSQSQARSKLHASGGRPPRAIVRASVVPSCTFATVSPPATDSARSAFRQVQPLAFQWYRAQSFHSVFAPIIRSQLHPTGWCDDGANLVSLIPPSPVSAWRPSVPVP